MKKIICLIYLCLIAKNISSQNIFDLGDYYHEECKQMFSFGYSRSITHQGNKDNFSFNHVNEIYVSAYFIEMSFYWDHFSYKYYPGEEFTDHWNYESYTKYKTSSTQFGYTGFKLGIKTKYFSFGIASSFGADCVYFTDEYTHYHYIGIDENNWEMGSMTNDYSEMGQGFYAKIHYLIVDLGIEPFIAFQTTWNNDTFISLGMSYCFDPIRKFEEKRKSIY